MKIWDSLFGAGVFLQLKTLQVRLSYIKFSWLDKYKGLQWTLQSAVLSCLRYLAVPDEPNHLQKWFDLRGHPVVRPGAVVELAHRPLLLAPAQLHGPHKEVRTDLPRLEQRDRVHAELSGRGVRVHRPVALAFVLSRLLLVAGHHDHLHLSLHHHPPPVVDGVRQRALAGDVGVAPTGSLYTQLQSTFHFHIWSGYIISLIPLHVSQTSVGPNLNVVCIDVVGAGDTRVVGQEDTAVVEGEDILIAVFLPVNLLVSFTAGEVIFVLQLVAKTFQSLETKNEINQEVHIQIFRNMIIVQIFIYNSCCKTGELDHLELLAVLPLLLVPAGL